MDRAVPDRRPTPGKASPEARYEQLESIELAFVAAVQHLGANQRAVLMLRDVLGFSAQESADMLSTSVASVNSALQRARSTLADKAPAQTQQVALRKLGEDAVASLVDRYIEAWERNDVPAFASMLAEDATFAMPPLSVWYSSRDNVVEWARRYSINGEWQWKVVVTTANAQPALAFYAWDAATGAHVPFALNVLSLRDGLVSDVTAFIVRGTDSPDEDAYVRFPEQPMHARHADLYERFGLPAQLT